MSDRIDSIALAASAANTIYAATGGHHATSVAHVFVTFNGTNWQQRDIAGATDHIHQLVVDSTNNMTAYAVRDRFGGGHVFRTANAGVSWANISGDLPDIPTYSIAVDTRFSPSIVYIGTDSGVYFTTDPTAAVVHWSPFKTGLPNVQVTDLKLSTTLVENDKNILAAATHGRGIWEILIDRPAGLGGGWNTHSSTIAPTSGTWTIGSTVSDKLSAFLVLCHTSNDG